MSERECFNNFCGLPIFSMYIMMTRELVSGSNVVSKCSRTSSIPTCAELPTAQTLLNVRPFVIPYSLMNTAVAPEPVTKSTP